MTQARRTEKPRTLPESVRTELGLSKDEAVLKPDQEKALAALKKLRKEFAESRLTEVEILAEAKRIRREIAEQRRGGRSVT